MRDGDFFFSALQIAQEQDQGAQAEECGNQVHPGRGPEHRIGYGKGAGKKYSPYREVLASPVSARVRR